MISIRYQRLGFRAGVLAGLTALLRGAASLGSIAYLDSVAPGSRLHNLIDEYAHFPLRMATSFVLSIGLPVTVLLLHRRVGCAVGMLLVAIPATGFAWIEFVAAALSSVKCFGSCD